MSNFNVGSEVQWKWMGRIIVGVIKEEFFEPVTKEIKGKKIKRNGSKDKPAYLVESEAGNLVLKLQTELIPHEKPKLKKSSVTPKMFSDDQ